MPSIYDDAISRVEKKEIIKKEKQSLYKEVLLTFTTNQSKLSSKKIERAILFFVFLVITCIFIFIKIHELETLEFIEILLVWLGYAGYNTHSLIREKKIKEQEQDI
jgi:Ca2+/Na+ antiporter